MGLKRYPAGSAQKGVPLSPVQRSDALCCALGTMRYRLKKFSTDYTCEHAHPAFVQEWKILDKHMRIISEMIREIELF
jgi:hypothetical protein